MFNFIYTSKARIILVVLQIAVVSIWHDSPWLVFVATSVVALLFLASFHFKMSYIKCFFLFGFLGAAAEFFPVLYGAWSYATAVPIGLPAYLPVIWGTAGIAIIHTAEKIGFYDRK